MAMSMDDEGNHQFIFHLGVGWMCSFKLTEWGNRCTLCIHLVVSGVTIKYISGFAFSWANISWIEEAILIALSFGALRKAS